ncbi:MAG: hypothetical protein QXR53_01930 [Candidatus Norongarragalinales archaeon]
MENEAKTTMAENKQGKWSFSYTTQDGIGRIEINEDDLTAFGRKIGRNMVSAIRDVAKASLGKVEVEFEYYDLMGNKETVKILMNENEFRALKKTLGK